MKTKIIRVGLGLTFAIAPLAVAQTKGNIQRGRQVFTQCAACHSLDGTAKIGPSLRGIHGRKAGALAGYGYSPAMKASGVNWDNATLDAFLQAPRRTVPGNRMPFPGMGNAQDRQDVVAYLATAK